VLLYGKLKFGEMHRFLWKAIYDYI